MPVIDLLVILQYDLAAVGGNIPRGDPSAFSRVEVYTGVEGQRHRVMGFEVQRRAIDMDGVLSFLNDVDQFVNGVDHQGFSIPGAIGVSEE